MFRTSLALTLALALAAAQPKKDDPFLAGPAFTFADLQKAASVVFEGRLKLAIERRGVANLTDPQLEQLKAAGATPAVLDAIRTTLKANVPAPQPVPTQKPTGRLTLQCAPAECDILLNGAPAGRTREGLLDLRSVPIGEIVVDFRRPGYKGEQITVAVDANASRVKAARLSPDTETMRKNGRELLRKMTAKLGVENVPPLTLVGTAILWTDGQRSDWKLQGNINPEAQSAALEIQGAGVKWKTSLKGSATKSDGSGKLKGGPVALEMEKLLRLFYLYQPGSLLRRLTAEGAVLQAADERSDDHGQRLLRAQVGPDSFAITVAPDGTPTRIESSGMELLLAGFESVAGRPYPRTIQARVAGTPTRPAHELRFDKITADKK